MLHVRLDTPQGYPTVLLITKQLKRHALVTPKALAIASSLSQNLYVDHGQAAYKRIFDDAMMRGDLNTALYLAEHPVRLAKWTQADVWRQIAELQATRGG